MDLICQAFAVSTGPLSGVTVRGLRNITDEIGQAHIFFKRIQLGGTLHMGVSQNYGYHFGGTNNKDYNILGSILGSPYLGKLPYHVIDACGHVIRMVLLLARGKPARTRMFLPPAVIFVGMGFTSDLLLDSPHSTIAAK